MTSRYSPLTPFWRALLAVSIGAATSAAWSADDAAPATAAPHRPIPTVSVSSDGNSLAALQEALAPKAEELGCVPVPTASSSPRHGKHHQEHAHKHSSKTKNRPNEQATAFYGCGGEDATQKLLGAAEAAVGPVLEKHPDTLIQVAKVFVHPTAFLSNTCPTLCIVGGVLKPGNKIGAFCFVCAAK
jgi:hypothetical protein